MDHFVLFVSWQRRAGVSDGGEEPLLGGLEAANNIYNSIKENCRSSSAANPFPACSLAGIPGVRKWFFAVQAIYGDFQFSSSNWEEINLNIENEDGEDNVQTAIEECLGAIQSFEDDDSSRDSISLADLFAESADCLHQLSDKLPAPGRAMVDVILLTPDQDAPRLKDCLPAIGAFKHMREWHLAKITVAAKDIKGWQKIAEYLSARIVTAADLERVIDWEELWRGKIQICEKKFGSDVIFPDFCLRDSSCKRIDALNGKIHSITKKTIQIKKNILPEVFHYYSSALDFVQMVMFSDIPPYFISDLEFELDLTRNSVGGKSKLLLDQLSSLHGEVGALFILSCNVSSILIPPSSQLNTKKWKEYMARKPKVIGVPYIEMKGEMCTYYFFIQSNGSGACKAKLIHSANQISGAAALAVVNGRPRERTEETETGNCIDDLICCLPHFNGDQLMQREKRLIHAQTSVLKECLRRLEVTKTSPTISASDLKTLLTLTREHVFSFYDKNLPKSVLRTSDKRNTVALLAESNIIGSNPKGWPEKCVLQNLENFEKTKQKLSENAFLLTPKLTVQKVKKLSFEKAAMCCYHGLEYCLDNQKALERDIGLAELQSRLIRYETQTTCSRECCPIPSVLSPLPSPAVLSEPGSVPDGESLSEVRTETSRLKRRSKDMDNLYSSKRLAKSESTDSLLSQASGSSGHYHSVTTTRQALEPSKSTFSGSLQQSRSQASQVMATAGQTSQKNIQDPKTSKEIKESRSQKHTRMLREVVAKTLQNHGIGGDHKCFEACSQRLFDISKYYLKDLKTSRGLLEEMKKTANNNAKQVIQWELERRNK
ncbi:mdm2-binding protein isoform X2 [Microcaecilia unicolor]|uniref:Mdm2-binding protein isoform X2 n=1 Tax=Microcaecilia unicolor TaxID=1415580 RepID=A0A6P7ZGB7_9AMPH|nr:mdm2-binding protein isoform X2 [Microcaecilia unicolor]